MRSSRARVPDLVVCFLGFLLCGAAWAQEAKVRTELATSGDLWVGQRVTFVVELLAPGFFSGTAAFDLPDPHGMLLIPPEGSPVVSSEDVGGAAYTVQRHELAVIARRGGDQIIPSLTVRFHFKRNPLDKQAVDVVLKTLPMHFTAKVPPGAENLGNVISARQLSVVETWKPEPGKAKAGDAFTRTITFTAPDVPAMAFPSFPTAAIEGLGIYPKAPEVFDHSERGTLTGARRDAIIYVCQRAGHFTIPAARLTWWNLDAKKLQSVDFPPHVFEVAPNPALASAKPVAVATNGEDVRSLVVALLIALGLNALILLAWKFRAFWQPYVDAFRPAHLSPLNPGAPLRSLSNS